MLFLWNLLRITQNLMDILVFSFSFQDHKYLNMKTILPKLSIEDIQPEKFKETLFITFLF